MTFRAAGVLAAAIVALGLTGCVPAAAGPPSGRAVPRSIAPLIPITDPRVLAQCPPVPARHLDAFIAPTDIVRICQAGVSIRSDGLTTYGPWQIADLIPHPEALIDAYHRPNARIQPGACTTLVADPLMIWVDRGGIVTTYYAPVDGCGQPSTAAATAYRDAGRRLLVQVDSGDPAYRRPTTDPFP